MGRPRKTDRHDDDFDDRDDRRERGARIDDDREDDLPMFSDSIESPFHIPKSEWPDGLAFRWISTEVTGAPDNRNWSIKTAAHWVPVPRGKYPHIDKRFPSIPMPGGGGETGVISFGGLCLCERDIRLNKRDERAQQKATQDAGRTVESYVEGGNSNFPRVNMSKPVEYERGVRPAQFKE